MPKPREGFHDLVTQIPEELWRALCGEAGTESRSATGQLIHILRQRYGDADMAAEEKPAKTKRGKK